MTKKIKLEDTVQLFYFPKGVHNYEAIRTSLENFGKGFKGYHIFSSEGTIKCLLSCFDKEEKIYFWIHVDRRKSVTGGLPTNLSCGEGLKNSGLIKDDLKVIYFTSGVVSDLDGKDIGEKGVGKKVGKDGKIVYSLNVFIDEPEILPPPSKPSDFLPNTKQQDGYDRDFLSNILEKELLRNEKIDVTVIRTILEAHSKLDNEYEVIAKLNPFLQDDSKKYDGLIISSEQRDKALAKLQTIKSTYEETDHEFIKFLLADENWGGFEEWVKNMETAEKYRDGNLYLPRKKCYTPIKDGKHSFLDLGKLSADLEISVMPETLVLNNTSRLKQWGLYHYTWIFEEDNTTADPDSLFADFYNIQEVIYQYVERQYKNSPMGETHIKRQFQMLRLHYFLKALACNNMNREKTLFLIWASIHILEYLAETASDNN